MSWFRQRERNVGSADGVRLCSLIGSAKLNGFDPEFCLRTDLARIADHPISCIEEPLPRNIALSLQTESSQAG